MSKQVNKPQPKPVNKPQPKPSGHPVIKPLTEGGPRPPKK